MIWRAASSAMLLLRVMVTAALERPRPSKVKLEWLEASVTPLGAVALSGAPPTGCGTAAGEAQFPFEIALIGQTDTLGLVMPQVINGPYGAGLQEIRIRERVPLPLVGLYVRADAPLTPAGSAMAQAITATARRLARER